jgi:hypothetical protein
MKKKDRTTLGLTFGISPVFPLKKTRRFPSPPHERVGFIGIKFDKIFFPWKALKKLLRQIGY